MLDPEVFEDAADAVERDGWLQLPRRGGTVVVGPRPMCSGNHLSHCVAHRLGSARLVVDYHEYLADYLDLPGGDRLTAVWRWNDTPGRTQQEVLDTLRGCAKELRRAVAGHGE
jgi:hypothetical protein